MRNSFPLTNGVKDKFYFIKYILGNSKFKRRLLDLGFVNSKIKIIKKSAFSGVYLLEIRSCVFALKKKEVQTIYVVNLSEANL